MKYDDYKKEKERFLSKVNKTKYCWVWKAAKSSHGYGSVSFKAKTWSAHKLSYFFFIGKIKQGLFVCHTCDNPSCVKPSHLFLGTPRDNTIDSINKNRFKNPPILWKDFCKRGHKLSEIKVVGQNRACEKCIKIRSKNKYIEQRKRRHKNIRTHAELKRSIGMCKLRIPRVLMAKINEPITCRRCIKALAELDKLEGKTK